MKKIIMTVSAIAIAAGAWTAGTLTAHRQDAPAHREMTRLMDACVQGKTFGLDTTTYTCRVTR
jgi:hypothetical protein